MIRASDLKPQGKVPYLWRDRFPVGAVSVIAGLEGSAKSMLTAAIAAEISQSKNGNGIFANEEDPLRVSRSRLQAAGANVSRIFMPDMGYVFPDDLDRFESDVQSAQPKVVIFDAASQHLPYLSNDQAVRKALTPISWMAEEYEFAAIFVAHSLRSAKRGGDIKHAIQGPALTRAARVLAIMGEVQPIIPRIGTDGKKRSHLRGVAFVKDSYREKPEGVLLELDTTSIAGANVPYLKVLEENVSLDPYELLGSGAERAGAWKPRRRSVV